MTDSQKPTSQTAFPVAAPLGTNPLSLISLILGAIGITVGIIPLLMGFILSIIPTILAIIFGALGLSRVRRLRAGAIPSILGLLLGITTIFLYFNGYGIWW